MALQAQEGSGAIPGSARSEEKSPDTSARSAGLPGAQPSPLGEPTPGAAVGTAGSGPPARVAGAVLRIPVFTKSAMLTRESPALRPSCGRSHWAVGREEGVGGRQGHLPIPPLLLKTDCPVKKEVLKLTGHTPH